VLKHNESASTPIGSLLVPGLGTGVGEVPPERAARQMKHAYDTIIRGHGLKSRNAGTIWGEHQELLS
jgi:O-acetyl-ADP-ribose deacetylase (regulator of RNase III)